MAISEVTKARINKHVLAPEPVKRSHKKKAPSTALVPVVQAPLANYRSATKETYEGLEESFKFYNDNLFESKLPEVFFTIHRKRKANGYFWPDQFKNREDGHTLHEIALNPETMDRTMESVFGTLVHEMCHLWQKEFGHKYPEKVYHNTEFAAQMEKVGLICSADGTPGGKKTGRNMNHYVDENGPFAALRCPVVLPYFTQAQVAMAKKKDLSKVKYTCPTCQTNIWGKLGINVTCGECDEKMEPEE